MMLPRNTSVTRSRQDVRVTTRAARDLVAVRATVATGLSVLLAIVAHVSAGGLLPAGWALAGIVAFSFAGCALWLGHRISRRNLALLLVSAQTTIHFAMTALAGHGDDGGLAATTATGALHDAVHHLRVDAVSGAPMMAAHLLAAALTGLALGQGERALWSVLHLLARAARFVAQVLPTLPRLTSSPGPAPSPATTAGPAPRRTSVWLADTHVRRGPPALLTAP
jgi:hypothetical protein